MAKVEDNKCSCSDGAASSNRKEKGNEVNFTGISRNRFSNWHWVLVPNHSKEREERDRKCP